METGEGVVVDPLVVVVALGWAEAAEETRLSADVTEGCDESFMLDVTSRAEATDAADEGSLPKQ